MDFSLSRLAMIAALGVLAVVLFVPSLRGGLTRAITNISSSSETITVPGSPSRSRGGTDNVGEQDFELITLLGFDAIPAILDPEFLSVEEAREQLKSDELVLGLSINGDSPAYSIPMLSAHEIVNDIVGGVPVAITW